MSSPIQNLADITLEKSGLWQSPYLHDLSQGLLSREGFLASQEEFYHAVAFFSRPMAALLTRLPDYESRIDILHNVVEEHGDFRPEFAHATTFCAFLTSIGGEPAAVRARRPVPAVHAFNSVLLSACLAEEIEIGVACVGIIEHAFARISAEIGQAVIARQWVKEDGLVHYAMHAELDVQHAEEFFRLLTPRWSDPEKRVLIEQGLALGAYIFTRLYRDMHEIAIGEKKAR